LVHQNLLNQEESNDFHQEHHFPETYENPKIEPLYSWISKGNHKEKNHKGFMHTPPTKSQRERSQIRHKKMAKKRLRKSPKKENRRDTIKP
jgi:hypothetical protein